MNKKQLISAIADTDHFETKKAAGEFLEDFIKIVTDTVSKGEEVRITDFGKFEVFTLSNGTKVPKFRPYLGLRAKVA